VERGVTVDERSGSRSAAALGLVLLVVSFVLGVVVGGCVA
jgi:hypothetical protein